MADIISATHSGVMSRKRFFSVVGVSAAGLSVGSCTQESRQAAAESGAGSGGGADEALERRIADVISAYDAQGIHRTGTEGDQACAQWLAGLVDDLGIEPRLEGLPFERIDVVECFIEVGSRRIEGVPLFDALPTGPEGITGRLTSGMDEGGEISFVQYAPTTAGGAELAAYRRQAPQQAVVAVSGGEDFGLPQGITLVNAEEYQTPTEPSTIHVGSEALPVLREAAVSGEKVRFVNYFVMSDTEVFNTTASVLGADPDLPPLVVMTPRSGWWRCASERGGGIAVWLEMMRALAEARPERTTHFVASTGHELGHYGLDHYLQTREVLIGQAVAWIHLGANFGAVGSSVLFQSSDEEYRQLGREAMARYGGPPDRETLPGDRPLGEARDIFDGRGRYLSLLGNNRLFHHPDDRWPEAVDVSAVAAFAAAFGDVARRLAGPGQV